MLRFVVLRHEPGSNGPRDLHWDLMFENGKSLRTWALDREPQAGTSIAAVELPEHRAAYLDYEGTVSGERGAVTRVERGNYTIAQESNDELVIDIAGEHLCGTVTLHRKKDQRWVIVFDDG